LRAALLRRVSIVADGEGSTKVVRLDQGGRPAEAERVAAPLRLPLVKTATARTPTGDWVVQAAGQALGGAPRA
jgi:N-acetylglutamate synthase/N-acetylornithine aminotransferase